MEYDANENYIKLFKEWLHEQNIHVEDCQNAIKTCERIIESNKRQIEFYNESINTAVQDFNKWAEENGEEKISPEAIKLKAGENIIPIESLKALELGPKDTLIIETNALLSKDANEKLKNMVSGKIGGKILILDGGFKAKAIIKGVSE